MAHSRFSLIAFTLALSGCAGMAEPENSRMATPIRSGEEVSSICFERNINNFKAIKDADDVILLEAGVNDWYKATLIGACGYDQLQWMQGVAIESHPNGGCVTPGDYLVFTRSAFGDMSSENTTRCAISEIYKWDEAPLERDE